MTSRALHGTVVVALPCPVAVHDQKPWLAYRYPALSSCPGGLPYLYRAYSCSEPGYPAFAGYPAFNHPKPPQNLPLPLAHPRPVAQALHHVSPERAPLGPAALYPLSPSPPPRATDQGREAARTPLSKAPPAPLRRSLHYGGTLQEPACRVGRIVPQEQIWTG